MCHLVDFDGIKFKRIVLLGNSVGFLKNTFAMDLKKVKKKKSCFLGEIHALKKNCLLYSVL